MTDPTQIAIIGCGPAGLLAAHAALLSGHEPRIFSIKQKSVMPGTQYLHQPIPLLSNDEPDGEVTYIKRGTKQGYAAKVYGSPDAPCSWSKFVEGRHTIWHLGQMYDDLWETFESSIKDMVVKPEDIGAIASEYPLVISSAPAHRMCSNADHNFKSQMVWITDKPDSYDEGTMRRDGNYIIYDGTHDVHWYRRSVIFGKQALETTKPMDGWMRGHKPITTDCDCQQDLMDAERYHRVGRFGLWQKGILSHSAFWDTLRILDATIGRNEDALF